jgi:hypothetical protein
MERFQVSCFRREPQGGSVKQILYLVNAKITNKALAFIYVNTSSELMAGK